MKDELVGFGRHREVWRLLQDPDGLYDERYWNLYVEYSRRPTAAPLMQARTELVARHVGNSQVVDVGIGCGQFIDMRGSNTWGYDVNPVAIKWLLERELWWDPWFRRAPNATLWDALEHMDRPDLFLERVAGILFVSLPIFSDREHVLKSKHFKPREHLWYFTRDGLVAFLDERGFELVEENRMEIDLGREDIGTFVFERRAP